MKKTECRLQKTRFWLTPLIILLLVLCLKVKIYPKDPNAYQEYLQERYGKDFRILDKIDTNTKEFKEYSIGYRATLKENTNIVFVVGYGKHCSPGLPFCDSTFLDNYLDEVDNYLRSKYDDTITIESDYEALTIAKERVRKIIDDFNAEYDYYSTVMINDYTSPTINIIYDGVLYEDVHCSINNLDDNIICGIKNLN